MLHRLVAIQIRGDSASNAISNTLNDETDNVILSK